MKKLLLIALLLALLALTAAPALAAGGPPASARHRGDMGLRKAGNMPFSLAGTITSLDPTAQTVTVKVAAGNTLVRTEIGKDLTIQTNGSTRFLLHNPSGSATPISFAELAVGQKVSVYGTRLNNVWTALRITVGARLVSLP